MDHSLIVGRLLYVGQYVRASALRAPAEARGWRFETRTVDEAVQAIEISPSELLVVLVEEQSLPLAAPLLLAYGHLIQQFQVVDSEAEPDANALLEQMALRLVQHRDRLTRWLEEHAPSERISQPGTSERRVSVRPRADIPQAWPAPGYARREEDRLEALRLDYERAQAELEQVADGPQRSEIKARLGSLDRELAARVHMARLND